MEIGIKFMSLDEAVKIALNIAQSIARENLNGQYGALHLLKALLNKDVGLRDFIQYLGKDIGYLEEWADVLIEELPKSTNFSEMLPDTSIDSVLQCAEDARIRFGLLNINPICVLLAMTKPEVAFTAGQLKSFPIKEREILDVYGSDMPKGKDEINLNGNEDFSSKNASNVSILYKYCIELTASSSTKNTLPLVNRDKETRIMMEILGSRTKSNVLITGDAGVGKTALINGLAWNIVNGKVPSFLQDAKIFELDNASLIAGATYKGEIEDRLKNVIKGLRSIEHAILFIDEIHILLDSKHGNSGAGNILKPELSRGELTIIGATTIDEYRKVIEPDHAFSRRFEIIQLEEPDVASAVQMLRSVCSQYVEYHKVDVSNEAIVECVRLAKRYVKDRRLPDSAIGLLDMALSAIKMVNETGRGEVEDLMGRLLTVEKEINEDERLEELKKIFFMMQNRLSPILLGVISDDRNMNEVQSVPEMGAYLHKALEAMLEFSQNRIEKVHEYEIAAIVASKTGIPIGKIQSHEKERLLNMESYLRRRVVGQDHALKTLADAILESRSGMNKPGQPIGSFFLLGPTGTGKTELAKALAEALFNDEKSMIRFDMSEFKEEHSAATLYGAPPGYVGYEEGGMLVNAIRQKPYSVVLFDEIEKAHPSVYDIFLQIMDEGKLHDRLGKEGDFSNSIVLFTSNVGSNWLTERLSSGDIPSTTQIMEQMTGYFRPEFLARLSEIVPFFPISEDILLKIFDIQFSGVKQLLEGKGINIIISDEAKNMLANKGFTPKYGARQISGIVRSYLRKPISRLIIGEKLVNGQTLEVGLDDRNELTWNIH